eukprot:TRINITY_DN7413_c0_g1_i1.p1 TRINITY_DN7413_c0_g1~~TRINITY_DN7413_c0_g1_i1.p1  ORF type:complete len:121 (-),score=1.97 TRINITY_DN7413_c0_g1_i1:24-386(-)
MFSLSGITKRYFPQLSSEIATGVLPLEQKYPLVYSSFCVIGIICMVAENFFALLLVMLALSKVLGLAICLTVKVFKILIGIILVLILLLALFKLLPYLSLIHICRCRRIERCRSRWSPYH